MRQVYVEVRVFYFDVEIDGSYERMGADIEHNTVPFLNTANAVATYEMLNGAFLKALGKGIATEVDRVKPGPRTKRNLRETIETAALHLKEFDEEEDTSDDIIA